MTIFTIGYQGLTSQMFIHYLKKHQVACVMDVRHLPLSRKKGFSKTAMSDLLHSEHIEYYNYREFGTSKEMRDQLYKDYNYKEFFKKYAKSLEGKEDSMDEILDKIRQGKNVALLCFEKDAHKCHRSLLAKAIKKREGNGIEIKHIEPVI